MDHIEAGSASNRKKMNMMNIKEERKPLSKTEMKVIERLKRLAKKTLIKANISSNLEEPESGFEGLFEQLEKNKYSDSFFCGLEKHGRLRFTKPSGVFHNYRGNEFAAWRESTHLYDTHCLYQGFIDKDGFPDGPGICLLTGLKKMHIGHFKSGWWHGQFCTFFDNGDKWFSWHEEGNGR